MLNYRKEGSANEPRLEKGDKLERMERIYIQFFADHQLVYFCGKCVFAILDSYHAILFYYSFSDFLIYRFVMPLVVKKTG